MQRQGLCSYSDLFLNKFLAFMIVRKAWKHVLMYTLTYQVTTELRIAARAIKCTIVFSVDC